MLNCCALSIGYGKKSDKAVIDSATFKLNMGELTMLMGHNGAGKSTLLKTLSGILPPLSGTITLDGVDWYALSNKQRAQKVSVVLQNPKEGLVGTFTLIENLRLALLRGKDRPLFKAFNKKTDAARFKALVADTPTLAHLSGEELASALSGGQQQLLSILLSVVNRPRLWVLDEPTAMLDPKTSEAAMHLIADLVQNFELTAVMVTHSPILAARFGTRTLTLKEGKLLQ